MAILSARRATGQSRHAVLKANGGPGADNTKLVQLRLAVLRGADRRLLYEGAALARPRILAPSMKTPSVHCHLTAVRIKGTPSD